MKQQDAKPLIIRERERWVQTQSINPRRASARDASKFFIELQQLRSPLLDFQTRGQDKWQIVHGWLLRGTGVELISSALRNFGRCEKFLELAVPFESLAVSVSEVEQRPHEQQLVKGPRRLS